MRTVDPRRIKRLLISRTDNIGDVVLTLPMASFIKQAHPHIEITFLAREYVQAVVAACPHVDHFLSWDELQKDPNAASTLQSFQFDMVLHVFPNREVARLTKRAKIPFRVGTSRRAYHLVNCNRWIHFSRRNSNEHEALLNLKLLSVLNIKTPNTIEELIPHGHLQAQTTLPEKLKAVLDPNRFNLVIHPFSNGNGREWSLQNYADLINALPEATFKIFVTGVIDEQEKIKPLIDQCPQAHNLIGQLALTEFVTLLAHADGMLASSTGPLHIGAALGTKALGLYPPAPKLNPARWAPIGAQAKVIMREESCSRCKPEAGTCPCMQAIKVEDVAKALTP